MVHEVTRGNVQSRVLTVHSFLVETLEDKLSDEVFSYADNRSDARVLACASSRPVPVPPCRDRTSALSGLSLAKCELIE